MNFGLKARVIFQLINQTIMEPKTLYVHREISQGKVDWIAESFRSLKETFQSLEEGMYKIFIQKVKRSGGWRYKYHFGHVLPLIVEFMNRNEINQILDPMTGELIPIDVQTLHDYHKQMFNPALVKNTLKKKDARGNVPEYIAVPMTTTKMSDGDFINRFEEEIISTYANKYGICFLSREDFKQYFEDGKNSRMIIEMQMESI